MPRSHPMPLRVVTPATDDGPPRIREARAIELSSTAATIRLDEEIREFPVFVAFDGLAPYVVEARIVFSRTDVVRRPEPGLEHLYRLEFTNLVHGRQLGLERVERPAFVHRDSVPA